MGVLLALRRLADPAVADFLNDREPSLVLEAARAINDVPIDRGDAAAGGGQARPARVPLPLLRRVANANFRLGEAQDARVPGRARGDGPTSARRFAPRRSRCWASGPARRGETR